jgi:predicted SnoaL-like aldol condensation-catalyzing enzyme
MLSDGKFMVRHSSNGENIVLQTESHKQHNRNIREEKSSKSSLFWDSKKRKPGIYTIILLSAITIMLMFWVILDYVGSFHEIKVVIDHDGNYWCRINSGDEHFDIIGGYGHKEYSFVESEGITMEVCVYLDGSHTSPINITIYDNGNKAIHSSFPFSSGYSVQLEYVVGE